MDEGAGVTSPDATPLPARGITKAEHDELVAIKGRPLTQAPIRRRQPVDQTDNLGGMTVLDGVLAEHLRKQKEKSE